MVLLRTRWRASDIGAPTRTCRSADTGFLGSDMTVTQRSIPDTASTSFQFPPPTRDCASAELTTLLKRAATGETAAFAELYDVTAARVYGLALRIVCNPSQAEEVSQESFLKVWRTSSRFDARRGSAISWILMIAHAAAVDRVRSAQASARREEAHQRQAQLQELVRPDATHDLVCATFEARRVHDALAELPVVQREALMLAYFGGCTHSELAVRLGLPLGTAKTRIRNGLIRLRDLLEER